MYSTYNAIYGTTFVVSVVKATVCYYSMVGYIGISEILWLLILTLEVAILMFCVITYDPQFPPKSSNHNVYRTYILSLLVMVLTVWLFMLLAVYGFVITEVAIMSYLFLCLPIWLTLVVSFFELQKTYVNK